MSKSLVVRFASAVLGISLLVYLVWRTGPANLLENVRTLGWGLGLIIALGGVAHIVKTAAWRLALLEEKRQAWFARLFGLRLASEAAGQLGVLGQAFGETRRVSFLNSTIRLAGRITSVALDRALFIVSGALGLNIAEEIASRLGMNFAFGREFEELTQGSRTSPAYHGQATLSRWRIANPRVVRFQRQSGFWRPRWFLPRSSPFQKRVGGRVALVTQVEFAGNQLTVYNLHLESRGDDGLRLAQLDEVLRDAQQCARKSPVLLAGDLNFDASKVFEDLSRRRFGLRCALDPLPAATTPGGLLHRGHPIDWIFVSGAIKAAQGRVHRNVNASDHYPLSVTISAP